jgi:hypothetical protein
MCNFEQISALLEYPTLSDFAEQHMKSSQFRTLEDGGSFLIAFHRGAAL